MGGGGGAKPTGFTGTSAMSAEDLNSAMRGDIQASYLKGPTQKSYVGMSPETVSATRDMANAAKANSGILNDAFYFNRSIMDGTAAAPGYERLKTNAIDDTRTAINRQFGASGRFGAGSHVQDLGRGIMDTAAGLDYNEFQNDLNRRINAANNAGSIYENTMLPYSTVVQAHGLLDADRKAAASFDPNYEHLAKYQGLLTGNAGNPQPAKQPGFMDYAGLGLGLLSAFA